MRRSRTDRGMGECAVAVCAAACGLRRAASRGEDALRRETATRERLRHGLRARDERDRALTECRGSLVLE